jgi:type II secretory pathway component PulF
MKLLSQRVPLLDLLLFTRQCALMVRAGIPIPTTLTTLAGHARSPALRVALGSLRDAVFEGDSLAAGMRRSPRCFPAFYTTLVAAGEYAGLLDHTLDTISDQLESQRALRSRIVKAAIYPAVVCLTLGAVVLFLLTWVVPIFEELFAESGVDLPLLTQGLIGLSHWVVHYWLISLVLIVTVIALSIWGSRRHYAHRGVFEHVAEYLPGWRSLVRAKHSSECSTLLAACTRVGIPIMEALAISVDTIQSARARAALNQVRLEVGDGRALSAAFRDSRYFPELLSHLIEVGETSGHLESMLTKASTYYRHEFEQAIEALKQLLEPALMILIGLVVGITVVALYLPIFQLGEVASR